MNVEIKPSTIPNAGRGVFVTRDFSVGEYICYYDGYIKKNPFTITEIEQEYGIGESLIGYPTPRNEEGVGQLINDGDKLNIPSTLNQKEKEQELFRYTLRSSNKQNIYIEPGNNHRMSVYALENLKSGSELFYYYGGRYWLDIDDSFRKYIENFDASIILILNDLGIHRDPKSPSQVLKFNQEWVQNRIDISYMEVLTCFESLLFH
jgi:hypothetical protein